MSGGTIAQNAFNGGIYSPYLGGRDDTSLYKRGCKTLTNFNPFPQGAAVKRLGTKYVGRHEGAVRLIPFIFSEVDSYMLEFGDEYIRFYQSRDRVRESALTITNVTQANPAVVTISGHSYSNGDLIYIDNVDGMTELNGKYYLVANKTTNTFELTDEDGTNIDSTGYTAYSANGDSERVYTLTSPYTADDLDNIKMAQLGDIMYLTAGGTTHRPQKLSRLGNVNWTIADVDNIAGPVLDWPQDRTITLTASGTTGSITVTASSSVFESGHVGGVWELRDSSDTLSTRGYFRITGYTSATQVSATVQDGLDLPSDATSGVKYWREAAWDGVQGYPRAIAFHESRLFFAGTEQRPLQVYGSAANEAFESFDHADASDDSGGLKLTIAGQKNTIQWLVSDGDFLVCGTYGGLAFIGSGSSSSAITPTAVKAANGDNYGSAQFQGVMFNNSVKYLDRGTRKLYQVEYDDLRLKYIAKDLTIKSNKIASDGMQHMATVEEPLPAILTVDGDGRLLGMAQDENNDIDASWFEYKTGERSDGTFDAIEAVATIPGEKYDEIWLSVKRSVNGGIVRYIEYIEPDVDNSDFFVDSGIIYDGSATTTITGLDHLEGEEVAILADGATHPLKTVSNGSVALDRSASVVNVGRPFQANLEPMPLSGIVRDGGTSQSLARSIVELNLRLYKTLGLKVGRDVATLKEIPFRSTSDSMDSPPPLVGNDFVEDKEIDFNGTWDNKGNIYIRHDYPTPCTIVGLYAKLEVSEA